MAKKETGRFVKVLEESGIITSSEVWVDTQTGVQYLYHASGSSGGLTVLVDAEGRRITEYKGVVFGEVIAGVNFVKDFVAGLSNFFGGRSGTYEEELINARQQALGEMEQRAAQLGADAVVGVDIDYEVLGADNGMLMVTASGTAVRLD